jgi:broad specificity phosphatase PhoE
MPNYDGEVVKISKLDEFNQGAYGNIHDLGDGIDESEGKTRETRTSFMNRTKDVLEILKNLSQKSDRPNAVIIFGHSQWISMLLTMMTSTNTNIMLHEFPNCSITNIGIDENTRRMRIFSTGDVAHIPVKKRSGIHTLYDSFGDNDKNIRNILSICDDFIVSQRENFVKVNK